MSSSSWQGPEAEQGAALDHGGRRQPQVIPSAAARVSLAQAASRRTTSRVSFRSTVRHTRSLSGSLTSHQRLCFCLMMAQAGFAAADVGASAPSGVVGSDPVGPGYPADSFRSSSRVVRQPVEFQAGRSSP